MPIFPELLLCYLWLGSLALVLARVSMAKCRQDAGFLLAVGIEGPALNGYGVSVLREDLATFASG